MRTTITLDEDARLLIERAMRERGLTFKDAVNAAIKAGLGPTDPGARRYTTRRKLGPARMDLTKALSLDSSLEDEAQARRLGEGR